VRATEVATAATAGLDLGGSEQAVGLRKLNVWAAAARLKLGSFGQAAVGLRKGQKTRALTGLDGRGMSLSVPCLVWTWERAQARVVLLQLPGRGERVAYTTNTRW
jgi:hypothetical protein